MRNISQKINHLIHHKEGERIEGNVRKHIDNIKHAENTEQMKKKLNTEWREEGYESTNTHQMILSIHEGNPMGTLGCL